MRIRITILATAFLASATVAWAQGSATPTPAASTSKLAGTVIDFGFRGTSVSGDEARYERYRDLRTGVYSRLEFQKQTDTRTFSVQALNVGYRDQSYEAGFTNGSLKLSGGYDQTPLNYSYLTSTPWTRTINGSTVTFALDDTAQSQVQAKLAGIVGVPSSAAQLATRSIYVSLAQPFDMQQLRSTANLGATYQFTPDFGVTMNYATTKKSGTMPWAASFAFNNANELALPLDNRTNDLGLSAEWGFTDGLIRVAWNGSWFANNLHDMVWDNPIRLTDYSNGLNPPLGPYDPSGYSNGNGPAQGRMSLAPDSSMNVISAMGLYKMPSHTTLSAQVSFTDMRQNDALIPWTINPLIAQPSVYAVFPGLASLPRGTAEAQVKGLNALFNFTSRPNKYVAFTMRYRYNDHRNETPVFDAVEYVRFDAVPEETGGETEHFNITRRTLDASASFRLMPYTSLRVAYGFDAFDRNGRSFSDMVDDSLRVTLDTSKYSWLTIRGMYEHVVRTGSGFSEDAIEEGGAQPGLRFYDEADRTRNRGTLLVTLSPIDALDITASWAYGKDIYGGEGHEFGLLDNKNTVYNVGLTYTPKKDYVFGVNYGRDAYHSFQKSRNANPSCTLNVPPCAAGTYDTWTDPNRDWTMTNDEHVNNASLFMDVTAIRKTAIRVVYDFSDSDNAWLHGGPRVTALSTNSILTTGDTKPCSPSSLASCFIAMPSVTNQWQRLTADLTYDVTGKVGLGFSWWYEKFEVSDWGTIDTNGPVGFYSATGTPRIDWLGEISTGYGVRPYKGNTVTVRLLYKF